MASDDLVIERLLRVIDEGRRTATYKMALLVALIESVAEMPGESVIPTRVIAARVLELYYPQTRPYLDLEGEAHTPRQITQQASAVVGAVSELRADLERSGVRSVAEGQRECPGRVRQALDVVEATFVAEPIPRLQKVGGVNVEFLYSVDWPEGTAITKLRRERRDRVRLLDGVADRLVVLGPMLRPLIEFHWTKDVARWTRIQTEDEHLRTHLFGSARTAFPSGLVRDLRETQSNSCFYCGDRLRGRCEVDHFIAWSRWQNNAIENLVVADKCNGAKSDHVAAVEHLARWRLRLEHQRGDLGAIADRFKWLTSPERSWALARTTYEHLAPGTPLWLRGREFEFADGQLW